jgi:fibronectin type III domain protein
MQKAKRTLGMTCDLARKSRLAAAVALTGVLVTACGGGDGGGSGGGGGSSASPSAVAPKASGAGDVLVGVASAKGATTLSWVPPTENDDGSALNLTGYRIYWGLNPDNLTSSVTIENPGLTRYVIEQLQPATYYFVATALSKDGESEPSNVIAMKVN